jgi:hypothetical protein
MGGLIGSYWEWHRRLRIYPRRTPEPKDQLFFRSAEAEAAAKARDLKSRCSKIDMRIGASPTGFDARRVASRASPALDLVH